MRIEYGENRFGNSSVVWKHLADEVIALTGQMDLQVPTVMGIFFPDDQAPLFQIVDHHGHVAAGFENLVPNFLLAQRAEVIQCLQHAELTAGQPFVF